MTSWLLANSERKLEDVVVRILILTELNRITILCKTENHVEKVNFSPSSVANFSTVMYLIFHNFLLIFLRNTTN